MRQRIDYSAAVGMRKGIMTVASLAGKINNKMHLHGICGCGQWKTFDYYNFMRGGQLSCGCKGQMARVPYDYKHPLYKIWIAIRARCNNPNDQSYYNYGGRGVRICQEWDENFKPFYDWCMANGWQKGLFVDKDIKGNGMLYSPETCAIVTRKANNQARKSVKLTTPKARELKESPLSARDASEKYGVSIQTVWDVRSGRTWKEGKLINLNDFLKDKPLY
jgi:hypothetical protein